jgi:hypothetical protein
MAKSTRSSPVSQLWYYYGTIMVLLWYYYGTIMVLLGYYQGTSALLGRRYGAAGVCSECV